MPHLEGPIGPAKGKRKVIAKERRTVVISKKRRFRGAQSQKILIQWRHITIPCTFLDYLTPATLIEDIGNSERVSPEAITKATLIHPNNPLATLLLDTPLSMQGIVTGDTLTLLVRHAKIHDPFDTQHLVAYREEDTMQYLLATLRDISLIPSDSEIVICHNGLRLKPSFLEAGSKIAIYLMSLPSMCASAAIRTPTHATNMHSLRQRMQPRVHQLHLPITPFWRPRAGKPSGRNEPLGKPKAKGVWPSG